MVTCRGRQRLCWWAKTVKQEQPDASLCPGTENLPQRTPVRTLLAARTGRASSVPLPAALLPPSVLHLLLDALSDVYLSADAVDAHVGWVWRNGDAAQAAQPAAGNVEAVRLAGGGAGGLLPQLPGNASRDGARCLNRSTQHTASAPLCSHFWHLHMALSGMRHKGARRPCRKHGWLHSKEKRGSPPPLTTPPPRLALLAAPACLCALKQRRECRGSKESRTHNAE